MVTFVKWYAEERFIKLLNRSLKNYLAKNKTTMCFQSIYMCALLQNMDKDKYHFKVNVSKAILENHKRSTSLQWQAWDLSYDNTMLLFVSFSAGCYRLLINYFASPPRWANEVLEHHIFFISPEVCEKRTFKGMFRFLWIVARFGRRKTKAVLAQL